MGTRVIYECSINLSFICGWSEFSYFESNLMFYFYPLEACRFPFPGSLKSSPKYIRELISPHQFFQENGELVEI